VVVVADIAASGGFATIALALINVGAWLWGAFKSFDEKGKMNAVDEAEARRELALALIRKCSEIASNWSKILS
jgi:hypothetical protein